MSSSIRRGFFTGSLAGLSLLAAGQSAPAQQSANLNSNRTIDQETMKRLMILVPSLKKSLESENPDIQKSTLNLLIDLPTFTESERISDALLVFLNNQKKLAKPDPELVGLGLRAWARTNARQADITKTLELFAGTTEPVIESAIAESSLELVNGSLSSGKPSESKRTFSETAGAVLPVLEKLLASPRPENVAKALKVLQIIGAELNQAVQFQLNSPSGFQSTTPVAERLTVVAAVLASPLPNLAKPLASPDRDTRLTSAQVIARFAMARDTTAKYGTSDQLTKSKLFELSGFKPMIDPLIKLTRDEDYLVRLAAVEALESVGTGFKPGELLPATRDSVLSVRWAAVRALGRISPKNGDVKVSDEIVKSLAAFANDPDVDLRSAALLSLQQHGKACNLASAEIAKAVSTGDVECRIIAMRTMVLGEVDSAVSVPAIIPALDDDIRLARAAAVALGRYGVKAKDAIPSLRKALRSSDQDLRLAAGEALLLIENPSVNPKKPKDD